MCIFLFRPSAHQLWVAESPDEGVCSLAIMNAEFAVHENEIPLKTGLLFAGHYNGQISLVSGKGETLLLITIKQTNKQRKTSQNMW